MSQTEATAEKSRRRWLRFSLRGLLIGIALLSVVVGGLYLRERRIVRERRETRELIKAIDGSVVSWKDKPSWPRPNGWRERLRDHLGDDPLFFVQVPDATLDQHHRITQAFPEAVVLPEASAIANPSELFKALQKLRKELRSSHPGWPHRSSSPADVEKLPLNIEPPPQIEDTHNRLSVKVRKLLRHVKGANGGWPGRRAFCSTAK